MDARRGAGIVGFLPPSRRDLPSARVEEARRAEGTCTGALWGRAPRRYQRPGARGRFAPGLALAQYAAQTWQKQDGFEVGMLKDEWGKLNMPLCLSTRGLLAHYEVDG